MSYTYSVQRGQAIPIAMVSALKKTRYTPTPAPYDLVEEGPVLWSDIISPARRQYEGEQQARGHLGAIDGPYTVHWPMESERIEYSAFFKRPLALRFSVVVDLSSQESAPILLRLTSASALEVTFASQTILNFCEYRRNQATSHDLSLVVGKEKRRLSITVDDYAERDTQLFVHLQYLEGDTPIEVTIEDDIDPVRVEEARSFLSSASSDRFNYDGQRPITLRFEQEAVEHLDLGVTATLTDAHLKRRSTTTRLAIRAGERTCVLPDLFAGQVGMAQVNLSLTIGAVTLSKLLEFEYYDHALITEPAPLISERKAQALAFIATHGVDSLQRGLAMALLGYEEACWLKILNDELIRMELRYDCSDFRLCALVWAYHRGVEQRLFPPALLQRMKAVLLAYRYHHDEPGTDVMWFFSENHAINFHAGQLLAAELFGSDTFTASGRSGAEQAKRAKALLVAWFDRFFTHGYEEWNSSVYIPIDLIALISLRELAQDDEIRALAARALAETFSIMAINSYRGVMASTYGRTYFKNLIGCRVGEASAINFIAFGQGYLNHHTYATTLFALSSYEVPQLIIEQYRRGEPTLVVSTATACNIPLKVMKSHHYILASAQWEGPARAGLQEHMVHLMIGDVDTQIWINHPGEYAPFGSGRPAYFAGNGTIPCVHQEGSTVTLSFDLVYGEVDFTHAYVPIDRFDEVIRGPQRWFMRKGTVYVEIFAENGLTATETGPFAGHELVSHGRTNCWVLRVATEEEAGSFTRFQRMGT
ncbi:MAG: hypothetical protein M0Q37_05850 [Sphaerochaeta sp.]|nr:hypothetical protein [Sphaerochaeta sp.]